MKSKWKTYLLYASLIIIGGGFIYLIAEIIQAKNTGFETKTLWDWMELLIIPLVLAIGAFFLNRSERAIERQVAEDRRREDRILADERANLEREIAKDRQQESALQSYLDRMADLLLEKELRTTENEEVKNIARTRTLTVLRGLDATRKGHVLKFLYEAELIQKDNFIVDLPEADLSGADLSHTNLMGANLRVANLSGADLQITLLEGANLAAARLDEANLEATHFGNADLRDVNLREANLRLAYLIDANLSNAHLNDADLTGAFLNNANLSGADLNGAYLNDANLSGANLSDAKVSSAQLGTTLSLKGAIMPDGTNHE